MTKKERRIAVLKDVLAQLKAEKFKAITGSYVNLPKELRVKLYDGEEYDAKTELLACTAPCKVCAKGSIFLSTVRKENQVKLADLDWDMEDESNEATKRVVNLFGGNNLNKIEAAFEKWVYLVPREKGDQFQYYSATRYSTGEYNFYKNRFEKTLRKKDERLVAFIKKHPNKKERLMAIVRNCIKNEGIFRP